VHGSESIPAIRILIWLRKWEVNGMGHHCGSEGRAGGLSLRVGLAMERDDQMTALWQGSGRKRYGSSSVDSQVQSKEGVSYCAGL
jgi:hypothetical protein